MSLDEIIARDAARDWSEQDAAHARQAERFHYVRVQRIECDAPCKWFDTIGLEFHCSLKQEYIRDARQAETCLHFERERQP